MANGSVVDELVVKLTLDASEYKKADKEVDQVVTATEKKRAQDGDKSKKRDVDALKRSKDATTAAKSLSTAMAGLSRGVKVLLGVGGAGGLVLAVAQLASMETGLRRAAVATGMSNREMQAAGSAARRLGADAAGGAQAIADLAREQQQFNITGQAPTMMALARIGVRAGPNTSIADMLGQAQQIYHGAAPGQQKQIEATLSAQGVSSDLIVMIKSEKDARAEFAKSYAESATENRKALDAVTDTLTTLAANAVSFANTLATIAEPAIKSFGDWVSAAAVKLSGFNDRMIAAGGGVDGFIKALSDDAPKAASELSRELRVLNEAVDVVTYGLDFLGAKLRTAWEWLTGSKLGQAKDKGITPALQGPMWDAIVAKARGYLGIANKTAPAAPTAGQSAPASATSGQELMSKLTSRGLTVAQAAAVASNVFYESSYNPGAFTGAAGGTGAHGLFQLRGKRADAFKAKYGVMPDKASADQQLDFMFSDPTERGLLNKSLGAGSSAGAMGEAFGNIFEAPGKTVNMANRARLANQLAGAAATPAGAGATQAGTTINMGTVNVSANNAQDFVGSIQRIAGPQNYNSGQR
jgi:hypothetical protein